MAALVILALDCAVVAAAVPGRVRGILLSVTGGFLTANVLGFGCLRRSLREIESPHFLAGFVAAGFLALVAYEVRSPSLYPRRVQLVLGIDLGVPIPWIC